MSEDKISEGDRVVDLFMVKLVKDTKKSLSDKEKLKAAKYGRSVNGNSRLWGTIRAERKQVGETDVTYSLHMEDYYYWVDKGRKKGGVSKEGQSNIANWIKKNNLNPVKVIQDMRMKAAEKAGKKYDGKKPSFNDATKQLTYIVARGIKKKGFEPNHFYSDVINDGRLEKLKNDYAAAVGKDLILDMKNIINGNNR